MRTLHHVHASLPRDLIYSLFPEREWQTSLAHIAYGSTMQLPRRDTDHHFSRQIRGT